MFVCVYEWVVATCLCVRAATDSPVITACVLRGLCDIKLITLSVHIGRTRAHVAPPRANPPRLPVIRAEREPGKPPASRCLLHHTPHPYVSLHPSLTPSPLHSLALHFFISWHYSQHLSNPLYYSFFLSFLLFSSPSSLSASKDASRMPFVGQQISFTTRVFVFI